MILGIKTADMTAQLWLFNPERPEPVAHVEWASGRDLSEQLLGRIVSLLRKAGLEPDGLKAVIIFSGPGSFTSLRIGHTVANALADSLQIPVVGAQGENWLAEAQSGLSKVKSGVPVLPHYGSAANITKPKYG